MSKKTLGKMIDSFLNKVEKRLDKEIEKYEPKKTENIQSTIVINDGFPGGFYPGYIYEKVDGVRFDYYTNERIGTTRSSILEVAIQESENNEYPWTKKRIQ